MTVAVEIGLGAGGGGGDYALPADLSTVWDPGIPGGIPNVTTIHTTISAATYGDGVTDATAAINAAIQAAGDTAVSSGIRQVVYLPAGSYYCSGTVVLNRSGVVLRGAGPTQTTILSGSTVTCIYLGIFWPDYPTGWLANLQADGVKGSKEIVITNAAAASVEVGDILMIDMEDGTAAARGDIYLNGGRVWLGDGQYHKRRPATGQDGPGRSGVDWTEPGPTWLDNANYNSQHGPWRSIVQQIEVTSKTAGASNTTLGLYGVLHERFTTALNAQVWHSCTKSAAGRSGDCDGTHYVGLESLKVRSADGVLVQNMGVGGFNTAFSWVKDVEIDGGAGGHIKGPLLDFKHGYRCEVRRCYIHHNHEAYPGSGSYGISLTACSDCLVEDNIAMYLCKPIVAQVSGGGNVVAYNYADMAIITGSGFQENAIDMCHQSWSHHDLIEGNWSTNVATDSTHGAAGYMTFFRNYCPGRNSYTYDNGSGTGYSTAHLASALCDAWAREHTFVGNVFGTSAIRYENIPSSHTADWAIYWLGDGGHGGTGGEWDDGFAASYVYRHANWDCVNGGVVWKDGELHELPDSFYLDAKPSFFGSLAWPWVVPTGASPAERVLVCPAKKRLDDGTPFAAPPA